MSYQDAYIKAWRDGPRAALEFLRQVFHAPENQHIKGKPSDYLSDDEDDAKLTPAQGFDKMEAEFFPRERVQEKVDFILECLHSARTTAQDQEHRTTPFNALLLTVGTYDWGDAILSSVHFNPETGAWKSQYSLNHELIHQEDNFRKDSDWFTFIYDLSHSDHYSFTYEKEEIACGTLVAQVRAAQYASYLTEVVTALISAPGFAEFPKSLPLYFLVDEAEWSSSEGTLVKRVEWHPALTPASLETTGLLSTYQEAAVPPKELPKDEKWLHLLGFIRKVESPQYQQLITMLKDDDELMSRSVEVARDAIEYYARKQVPESQPDEAAPAPGTPLNDAKLRARKSTLRSWTYLFWSIPGRSEEAADVTKRIFALPPPSFDVKAHRLLQICENALCELFGVEYSVPEDQGEEFAADFQAALDRMRSADNPTFQVLLAEEEIQLEHEDAVEVESWGEVTYDLEFTTNALLSAISNYLDKLLDTPISEREYDFLLPRLQALGPKAKAAVPKLLTCLDELERGAYRTNRALEVFPKVLYALGVEEPPERVREHIESQSYHDFDFYEEWATNLPKKRWAQFLASFAKEPSQYEEATAWEDVLSEGKHAHALFHNGILEHENRDEMLRALCVAVTKPVPKLTKDLLYSFAAYYYDKPKTRNLAKVVSLLCSCAEKDDANHQKLKRAELALLREAIDRGEGVGAAHTAKLEELGARYSDSPGLRYCEAEHALEERGAEACGIKTLEAVKQLSVDDLVYRKAVFQFTGIESEDWADATAFHGYALYSWATAFFQKDSYRDGSYSDGPKYIDRDLFFEGLESIVAKMSERKRMDQLEDLRGEFAYSDQLRGSSLESLCTDLSQTNWSISYQICKRLVAEPSTYADTLIEAYEWFREESTQREALLGLLWPIEDLRIPLLRNPVFQANLPEFISSYSFDRKNTCDTVFNLLSDIEKYDVLLKVAEGLPPQTIVGSFLSVNRGIQALQAFERGAALLQPILDETSKKKPEFVLLTTNKAVLLFQAGKAQEAEATLDELFAMDWSGFDYKEKEDDPMTKILGGDLNAQIRDQFKQYYAQAKYNAGCLYARRSAAEPAVAALKEAVTLFPDGYPASKLRSESDFASIQDLPPFVELLASLGESA